MSSCIQYYKGTILKAIHNCPDLLGISTGVVSSITKVQF